jgi:nitrogenase molybdenum-cofactor synthesis protein NifE
MNALQILERRKKHIHRSDDAAFDIACEKKSVAGAVSQRACVFCGSRVVLYPIVDAVHLIHGPIGCAAYTWDIRGALSSGPELHRLSFSTDLREMDVINGGEKKLYAALHELIARYKPKAAFVYATCIVGLIGDDIEAICRKVAAECGIPVVPVDSEGFKGTKKDGYKAACAALFRLVGTSATERPLRTSINILGDFNIAGETWIIRDYYRRMGVDVIATVTGDGRVDDIRRAHGASLNVVQCSGSMTPLAEAMQREYGIPFIRVSYFGIEDTAKALYDVAQYFDDDAILQNARELVHEEVSRTMPTIAQCREGLAGKRAAIYVGGAFKAFSLVKSLRLLGMETVVVGSQTGNRDDYELLRKMCTGGTIIVDDANTLELASFVVEKKADLLIGGVKERPIAYKLGVGFCDHNHERKIALAGFVGMANFAKEVFVSVNSPVWRFAPRNALCGEEASHDFV